MERGAEIGRGGEGGECALLVEAATAGFVFVFYITRRGGVYSDNQSICFSIANPFALSSAS